MLSPYIYQINIYIVDTSNLNFEKNVITTSESPEVDSTHMGSIIGLQKGHGLTYCVLCTCPFIEPFPMAQEIFLGGVDIFFIGFHT